MKERRKSDSSQIITVFWIDFVSSPRRKHKNQHHSGNSQVALNFLKLSSVYVFLCCAKFVSLIRSHLFIFVSISSTLWDRSKTLLLRFMSKSVLPMFSPRNFIVFSLTFRSLIHFLCLFLFMVLKESSNFIFFFFRLHWLFIARHGLSVIAASRGCSWLHRAGLSSRASLVENRL